MADIFTPKKRSEIMRRVKSKKNKSTEVKLINYFNERGITGWRRHYKVTGKPDFVFPKYKVMVFTDGCFWHGHNCRNLSPEQNKEYWIKKIERNKQRDKLVTERHTQRGWNVIRIWECKLKDKEYLDKIFYGIFPEVGAEPRRIS